MKKTRKEWRERGKKYKWKGVKEAGWRAMAGKETSKKERSVEEGDAWVRKGAKEWARRKGMAENGWDERMEVRKLCVGRVEERNGST